MKKQYRVTDATIYSVDHPLVTEHRCRMIEEVKRPEIELSRFELLLAKLAAWAIIFVLIAFLYRFL